MKVVIDLIEDIRESIGNDGSYSVSVGLLKEDPEDASRLIYSGEADARSFWMDKKRKALVFGIDGGESVLTVGEVVPSLLIADMDAMMYGIKVDLNGHYRDMEVVGFGKNDEAHRYVLFIKP